ncbi:Uncharacterized protein AC499_1409 [Pseudomonas amygdali pv. lachrymans]|uniref:HTH cro/C1-type domain-containing protein n=2 Tax=Pseudomonas amygdali pv. lachrymans TaxID=53707 RepID=A0ABR5KR47_PSEAV|nr:Uncharacterized protein AC499_0450 [Pseudomonas amygdali pv. lachrymans]KPC18207.1 Uncharacterized protein AC499_1409 [Pseudomonas amygdali pv. lachrymans]
MASVHGTPQGLFLHLKGREITGSSKDRTENQAKIVFRHSAFHLGAVMNLEDEIWPQRHRGTCKLRQALFDMRVGLGLNASDLSHKSMLRVSETIYLEQHEFYEYADDVLKLFKAHGIDIEEVFGSALANKKPSDLIDGNSALRAQVGLRDILQAFARQKRVKRRDILKATGFDVKKFNDLLSGSFSPHVRALEILLTFYQVNMCEEISRSLGVVKLMPVHTKTHDVLGTWSSEGFLGNDQVAISATDSIVEGNAGFSTPANTNKIAELFIRLRRTRGESARELSEITGAPENYINKLESNKVCECFRHLSKTSLCLGIDIERNLNTALADCIENRSSGKFLNGAPNQTFSFWLKMARQRKGISIGDIVRATSVSGETIRKLERGDPTRNSLKFEKILIHYGVDFSTLFDTSSFVAPPPMEKAKEDRNLRSSEDHSASGSSNYNGISKGALVQLRSTDEKQRVESERPVKAGRLNAKNGISLKCLVSLVPSPIAPIDSGGDGGPWFSVVNNKMIKVEFDEEIGWFVISFSGLKFAAYRTKDEMIKGVRDICSTFYYCVSISDMKVTRLAPTGGEKEWLAVVYSVSDGISAPLKVSANEKNGYEILFEGCLISGYKNKTEIDQSLDIIVKNVFRYLTTQNPEDASW